MKIIVHPNTNEPQPNKGNETEKFIDQVLDILKGFNYHHHIGLLKSQDQSTKRGLVKKFQDELKDHLNTLPQVEGCVIEKKVDQASRDSYDLFFKTRLDNLDYQAIIELDASRGDQVAKKFVLRTAYHLNNPTIYFAFCYPGTKHMSGSDLNRVLTACQKIASKLHRIDTPQYFIGVKAIKQ